MNELDEAWVRKLRISVFVGLVVTCLLVSSIAVLLDKLAVSQRKHLPELLKRMENEVEANITNLHDKVVILSSLHILESALSNRLENNPTNSKYGRTIP